MIEGDIGVCGIAVLANFSCGISVILILNCGIAVFSKPAGCVLFTFWSTIFGTKTYSLLFPTIFSRFGSNLKQPYFVTHFNLQFDCFNNQFKAVSLFPLSHRLFSPLFLPSRQRIHQLYRLTIKLRYFPIFFCDIAVFIEFFCGNAVFSNPQCPPHDHLTLLEIAVNRCEPL